MSTHCQKHLMYNETRARKKNRQQRIRETCKDFRYWNYQAQNITLRVLTLIYRNERIENMIKNKNI